MIKNHEQKLQRVDLINNVLANLRDRKDVLLLLLFFVGLPNSFNYISLIKESLSTYKTNL